jgi:anti-anti-sigma factor
MTDYQTFRVEMFQDVAIVNLQAKDLWDRLEIHRLSDELLKYMRDEQPTKLILDMSPIHRISSEAINALIRFRDQATARNAELRLCSLQSPVKEVLKITELDRLFHIYESLPEAFRGFSEE